ncbi:hypothetical protein V7S43_002498 [Phytophthora oleae]|uniref:Crinkler effector protein N-terminal domain-containing protein n=1 Tax=Phytophthora oleae TaxID=2107226 RepID=A0ABD3G1S0_9STRA
MYDLKEAIKEKKSNGLKDVDATELELFLAKKDKDDKVWLLTENQVKKGETGTEGFMKLYAGAAFANTGLSASHLKRTDEEEQKSVTGEGPVNVLVTLGARARMLGIKSKHGAEEVLQSVTKRQKVDTPEWKWMEYEPNFFLEKRAKFFVNRDLAMEQPQNIHTNNYNRAVKGAAIDWKIPIVDNICGLGKSAFVLRACHTLHIVLESGSLLTDNPQDENDFEKIMIMLICRYFDVEFQARPQALDPKLVEYMQSSGELLQKLTAEVGPVFVVLDEIGTGFDGVNVDDFGKKKLFLTFCR